MSAPQKLSQSEWEWWRDRDKVWDWQAVALSLDISPPDSPSRSLREHPDFAKRWKALHEAGLCLEREETPQRVMKGHNWVTREAATQVTPARRSPWAKVELRAVAQYAREMNWKVPPKFAAIGLGAAPRAKEQPGTKERATMLLVIAAALKAAKIEWKHPYKAAGALIPLVEQLGVKLSEGTIVKVLEQIPDAISRRGG